MTAPVNSHLKATWSPLRGLRLPFVALALAGVACIDGPFARTNPNDEEFEGTLALVASRDTITPANPVVVLKVVTDPVVTGYEPLWEITAGGGVTFLGNGIFRLDTPPVSPQPIEITAYFAGHALQKTIYRAPAP